VFEQKGEVGGRRRGEGEDQSEDHVKGRSLSRVGCRCGPRFRSLGRDPPEVQVAAVRLRFPAPVMTACDLVPHR
jgi:hypothetical protein